MPDISISSEVSSYRALIQSLPAVGIIDGDLTYHGPGELTDGTIMPAECILSNTTATSTQFQSAIDLAQVGTLISNKTDRIVEAESKTKELTPQGVYYTGEDLQQHGPIEVSINNRTDIRSLIQDVSEGLITLPQLLSTTDGRGVIVTDPLDLNHAYKAIIDRGVYLLGDQVNTDLSMGEALLVISIVGAVDQAALDAIVDTRV